MQNSSTHTAANHTKHPHVSVITVFHNGREQTIHCLKSIKAFTYPNFDVTVVDDGSTDGSSEAINKLWPDIHILKGNGDLWCNGSFNLAIQHRLKNGADIFLLLNNDNTIAPDALNHLVETHLSLNAPIVGSLVCYSHKPDTISYAGKRIEWEKGRNISVHTALKVKDIGHKIIEADFLGFQGVLVGKNVFEKIGLFDEKTFKHYAGDTDFYLRAGKAGFKILVDTQSIVWNDTDTTGLSGPSHSLLEFLRSLKSVKSIACLPMRYRLYKRHSPIFWLKPFGKYYLGLLKGQLAAMLKYRLNRSHKSLTNTREQKV